MVRVRNLTALVVGKGMVQSRDHFLQREIDRAMTFILDTSGEVLLYEDPFPHAEWRVPAERYAVRWGNLDPFTQGYVMAAFESVPFLGIWKCRRCGWAGTEPDTASQHFAAAPGYNLRAPLCGPCGQYFAESDFPVWGFSDLAPEALAAIMADCARARATGAWPDTPEMGQCLWDDRQAGEYPLSFPPLTPSLSDDGKVRVS